MRTRVSEGRHRVIIAIFVLLFGILGISLIKIQIIDGRKYSDIASAVSSKASVVASARGEIVDCNGQPLVFNGQQQNLIFDAAYFPTDKYERNKLLINLIKIFDKNKLPWNDELPLEIVKGKVRYKADCDSTIKKLKSREILNLNEYATAQNCFDALVEKYELSEYTPEEALKISSVLFGMDRNEFSSQAPYTFAEDVPVTVTAAIKENSSFYKGVEVDIVAKRAFADTSLAPHVLGYTGPIDAEEYASLKLKGYKMNDIVGKSGIELAMEEYLKGTDGERTIYTDINGNKTSKITKEVQNGNTVVLTINKELQKVAQDALRDALLDYENTQHNKVPSAGGVVVLSCKDSSILACATYPTYDMETYFDDYEKLATDERAPLWNRALLSTYATGSTAKPSVAIAALEEGLIDEKYTVYCNGTFTYRDQTFKCEQAHETAFVNVVNAIDESCNTFFESVGLMVGIEKMNEYRQMLGLGSKTGCELNESTGVLDSPEYRASLGQSWLPGYTIQSAIGQAGNLFTPIQLANYVNTIANGGTRYRTHFIKSVKNDSYSKTILNTEPEIVCQTGFSDKTLDIVKRGMLEVGTTGYCRRYFKELPVKVACKTGTSQEYRKLNGYSVKINNGFLIAFAPYENPEIAVAVVGEGMTSGVFVAPVVAAVVDYYCGINDASVKNPAQNVLVP